MSIKKKCIGCNKDLDIDLLDLDNLCFSCANNDGNEPIDFQAIIKEVSESIKIGTINIGEKDFKLDVKPNNEKASN